jgi:hypothetical protein
LGFLCSFGFWVFGLTLVFSFSAAFYLFWFIFIRKSQHSPIKKVFKYFLPGSIGIVLGLTPIILSTFSGNFPSILRETLGSVIASPDSSNFIRDILNHSLWLLLFGIPVTLGFRPPWEMRWIALPLIPFVIFFWGAIFISYFSRGSQWKHKLVDRGGLLLLVILFTILGFILTPFGNDPSGRYFLPLFVPMCIFASTFIVEKAHTWPSVIWLFPLLIMTYHAWGIFSAMALNPPGLTTQFDQVTQIDRKYDQDLVDFLLANEITHGYTNYWVAYPLAFLSAEEVIFVPKLPYHTDFRYTSRDNRYQPYNVDVDNAARAAYITTNFPELNQYLRDQFIRLQITWREREIGDYLVFYNISRHVRPGEVGLGIDR